MINFLHLFPSELGLNGEAGNLSALVSRLNWSGVTSSVQAIAPGEPLPQSADAVVIGSGALSGMRAALSLIDSQTKALRDLSEQGVPFFAVGYGWELLGESVRFIGGEQIACAGVFPSRSVHTEARVSQECFGFDEFGNLTTGYANHSGDIELLGPARALIELTAGYGNSSSVAAPEKSAEGIISGSLMATRLNGPVLPLNPHLADRFIGFIAERRDSLTRRTMSRLARLMDMR